MLTLTPEGKLMAENMIKDKELQRCYDQIETLRLANLETGRELTKMEGKIGELLACLERARPKLTAQRITEIRTSLTAGAGFRIQHEELLDLLAVSTKVLYMLQQGDTP